MASCRLLNVTAFYGLRRRMSSVATLDFTKVIWLGWKICLDTSLMSPCPGMRARLGYAVAPASPIVLPNIEALATEIGRRDSSRPERVSPSNLPEKLGRLTSRVDPAHPDVGEQVVVEGQHMAPGAGSPVPGSQGRQRPPNGATQCGGSIDGCAWRSVDSVCTEISHCDFSRVLFVNASCMCMIWSDLSIALLLLAFMGRRIWNPC